MINATGIAVSCTVAFSTKFMRVDSPYGPTTRVNGNRPSASASLLQTRQRLTCRRNVRNCLPDPKDFVYSSARTSAARSRLCRYPQASCQTRDLRADCPKGVESESIRRWAAHDRRNSKSALARIPCMYRVILPDRVILPRSKFPPCWCPCLASEMRDQRPAHENIRALLRHFYPAW